MPTTRTRAVRWNHLAFAALALSALVSGIAPFARQRAAAGDEPAPAAIVQEAATFVPPPMPLIQPIDEQVLALAFTPDGTKLITAGARHTVPGQLKVWDVATGMELAAVKGISGVRGLAISPDGRTIATADFSGSVRLRDVATAKELAAAKGHTIGINSVAFSKDGTSLVTAGLDRFLKLWDVNGLKERQVFRGHTDMIFSVAFLGNGKAFVSGGQDKTARIWDVATGLEKFKLQGHSSPIEMVAVSPDDKIVATASWDRTIKLWDPATGKESGTLTAASAIFAIAFSQNGKLLASATDQGAITIWNVETRQPLIIFKGHDASIWSLAFSPDGKRLASGSSDRTAKLWTIEVGTVKSAPEERTLRAGEFSRIRALAYSPDGKIAAIATDSRFVQLRDAVTGARLLTLVGHNAAVNCVAFSPDGRSVATGSVDRTIRLWDRADGNARQSLDAHAHGVNGLVFTPDGTKLVSVGDNVVKVWDAGSGKELAVLRGHDATVQALAVAFDGRTAASGGADGTIEIWDLAQQKELLTLKGHAGVVRALAFCSSGALASAGQDGLVKLWDPSQGKERLTLQGHNGLVLALAFSPGAKTLVTGGADGAIIVWDPINGQLRNTLKGHTLAVTALVLHPLGRELLSGSHDRAVLRWRGADQVAGDQIEGPAQAQVAQERTAASGQVQPKSSYRREYYHTFKGTTALPPELDFVGRNAEEWVKLDPGGVRITLPKGHLGDGPMIGVGTRFGIKGDFEITASFEVLAEPEPADAGPNGTRCGLFVALQTPKPIISRLSRAIRGNSRVAIAWSSLWDEAAGKTKQRFRGSPTEAKWGKLRLIRSGPVLSYALAADGASDYMGIDETPFAADDVKTVSLVGQTGSPQAWLDVRFTDVRIRADSLPGMSEPEWSDPAAAAEAKKGWLGAGLVIALLTVTGVVVGAVVYSRRRPTKTGAPAATCDKEGTAATPALVSSVCPVCGKNLRGKAELAGKKVKCPHCGRPVIVPESKGVPPSAAPADPMEAKRSGSLLLFLSVLLVVGGLALMAWASAALRADSTPQTSASGRTRFALDFRKPLDDLPGVNLIGPDAESVANTDPAGLRITVPAGRSDCRNVGVELPLRIHGDFDIDVGYELLAFGDDIPNPAAGVQMRLAFADRSVPLVALARFRNRYNPQSVPLFHPVGHDGETFAAYRIAFLPNGHEKPQGVDVRAEEPRGRLRLVRKGSRLDYLVSDAGSPYHLMKSEEVGGEDVDSLRLFNFSGWGPVAVDVRFTDLVIEAEQLPGGVPRRMALSKAWLAAAEITGLVLTVSLGAFFYLRYGRGLMATAQGREDSETARRGDTRIRDARENGRRMSRKALFAPALAVTILAFACSVYANLSFAVTNSADYRYFPPFVPHLNVNGNWNLSGESFNMAQALVAGRGYADPFNQPSGPTAWQPPLLATFLAALLWIFGGNRDALMTVIVLLQMLVLIGTGLLVFALVRQTTRHAGVAVAAWLFMMFLVCQFHLCFQATQDCWIVLLAVNLLIAGCCLLQPFARWSTAAGWGLFGGLCALINPIVGFVWAALTVARGVRRRAWLPLGIAGIVAGLTLVPWTVRNWVVFGRLIPIKSNLAYELYQSQCMQSDGLIQNTTFALHPYTAATPEGKEYHENGETAFLDHKRQQFWDAVRANPLDFAERVGMRFLGATLWYVPFERGLDGARPWTLWFVRLLHPLPFLAALLLVFTARRVPLSGMQWLVIGVYLLYLLPYVVIGYYDRYGVPLLGAKVLLTVWGLDRLLSFWSRKGTNGATVHSVLQSGVADGISGSVAAYPDAAAIGSVAAG
jgi:WD40 repeat protein